MGKGDFNRFRREGRRQQWAGLGRLLRRRTCFGAVRTVMLAGDRRKNLSRKHRKVEPSLQGGESGSTFNPDGCVFASFGIKLLALITTDLPCLFFPSLISEAIKYLTEALQSVSEVELEDALEKIIDAVEKQPCR